MCALGSLSFWLPILLARIVFSDAWPLPLIPLTFGLPVFVVLVADHFCTRFREALGRATLAFLFGIWVSGPFCIAVVSSFDRDAGFHVKGTVGLVIWGTLVFPFTTFSMASYQGSIFALLLSTIALAAFLVRGLLMPTKSGHP